MTANRCALAQDNLLTLWNVCGSGSIQSSAGASPLHVRDAAAGNTLCPGTNRREICPCGRRKVHTALGLVMENIMILLSNRHLKIVQSFKKQNICGN